MALLSLLFLLPVAAVAASPEDDYIAARDKYRAPFTLRENEQVNDTINKAEEKARAAQAAAGVLILDGIDMKGWSNPMTGNLAIRSIDGCTANDHPCDGPRRGLVSHRLTGRLDVGQLSDEPAVVRWGLTQTWKMP